MRTLGQQWQCLREGQTCARPLCPRAPSSSPGGTLRERSAWKKDSDARSPRVQSPAVTAVAWSDWDGKKRAWARGPLPAPSSPAHSRAPPAYGPGQIWDPPSGQGLRIPRGCPDQGDGDSPAETPPCDRGATQPRGSRAGAAAPPLPSLHTPPHIVPAQSPSPAGTEPTQETPWLGCGRALCHKQRGEPSPFSR